MKKLITICTGTYNEQGNIVEFYDRVTSVMLGFPQYDYEICCIDNCSTDNTRNEIREICAKDKRFKAVFNLKNFGPFRSGTHNFYNAKGDAVIALASDLEDPPEMIADFIRKWEEGYKLVCGVREKTQEKGLYPYFRKLFYKIMSIISDTEQITGFTGFGLYDKEVMEVIVKINDPNPYLRGLVTEFGWKRAEIPFCKPVRKRGISSYSFLRYYDDAMVGIVGHLKLPLRIASMIGVVTSGFSFCVAIYYFIQKLLHWEQFQLGLAPALIGIFFMMGMFFLFLGLIGEYIGLLVTHIVKKPLVIEEERINYN